MPKKIYSDLQILKQLKDIPKPDDYGKVITRMRELRRIISQKRCITPNIRRELANRLNEFVII